MNPKPHLWKTDPVCNAIADVAADAQFAIIGDRPSNRYRTGYRTGRGEMAARGCVYVIQCTLTGLVKIGWSFQPSARLRSIQADSPTILRLVVLMRGTMGLERRLHIRYAEYRAHGEWFRLSADALGELKERAARLNDGTETDSPAVRLRVRA